MLEIEKFIQENENWKELLQQPPYNLLCSEDEDYILFKYNQIDIKDGGSDFDEPIVCEARGIIIDKHNLRAVALSFPKFWNVQEERHAKIDWKHARVQEKVDGSKILVWYNIYKDDWQISTSGTLNAYEAQVNGESYTYGDLFDEALKNINKVDLFDDLLPEYCYTFELVSPKARIVIPYSKTIIYFIGVRSKYGFTEFKTSESIVASFVKTPKEYTLHTLEDCLKATEKMGFDEEGFVVVDDNWNRVKIKSPAYVAVHHLRFNGNISNARILELVERDEYQDLVKYYPEYQESVNKVKEAKQNFYDKVLKALIDFDFIGSRKEAAEQINKNYKDIAAFIFKYLDTDLYKLFVETEWNKLPKNKKLKYLGFKEEKDADEFKEE